MKYTLFTLLLLAGIAGKAQMKGDTTRAESRFEDELFQNIVLLMQQNKELSDRLDRLEEKIDTMHREINMLWEINRYNARYSTELDDSLMKRIDSLGRRPYLFYDPKGVRPGFYLTNSAGEYQIFVSPLK